MLKINITIIVFSMFCIDLNIFMQCLVLNIMFLCLIRYEKLHFNFKILLFHVLISWYYYFF